MGECVESESPSAFLTFFHIFCASFCTKHRSDLLGSKRWNKLDEPVHKNK